MMRTLGVRWESVEDFGSVRVLATESLQPGSARGLPLAWESIAGTTVEVACARTEQKTGEGGASVACPSATVAGSPKMHEEPDSCVVVQATW